MWALKAHWYRGGVGVVRRSGMGFSWWDFVGIGWPGFFCGGVFFGVGVGAGGLGLADAQ